MRDDLLDLKQPKSSNRNAILIYYYFIFAYCASQVIFNVRKTIKKLLESNGFRVLRISRVGNYYSLKYLCHKIMPYSPAFLKNLLNWIAKTTFGKILVYLNLFDIMTIYAVKL